MVTVLDVVSGVRVRLGASNIPTFLSDGSIADLASDRVTHLGQALDLSLNSGNFSASYLPALRDWVTADVLATRNNADIDTQISVGNITLNYRDKLEANKWQVQYFLDRAT